MNSTPDAPELPPLPEPRTRGPTGNALYDCFDLQAYARAALAARQPEPVAWRIVLAAGIGYSDNLPYAEAAANGWRPLYAQPPAELKAGWVMVPKEITGEMWAAGLRAIKNIEHSYAYAVTAPQEIWSAMLSSAPTGEAK